MAAASIIAETATWMRLRVGDIGPFRSEILLPSALKTPWDYYRQLGYFSRVERVELVVGVVTARRQLLTHQQTPLASTLDGRLVRFYPDDSLQDGTSPPLSEGYFDDDNTPPWDAWVSYVEEPKERDCGGYLLAWVPRELVSGVGAAIEINLEECIRWDES